MCGEADVSGLARLARLLIMRVQLIPQVGERAPDFTLPATDGGEVTLSRCGGAVALVFLRHLA